MNATLSQSATLLCHYRNGSPQVQVIRLESDDPTNPILERVVFPSQTLLFHGQIGRLLHIYSGDGAGKAHLLEQLPCDRLQVADA